MTAYFAPFKTRPAEILPVDRAKAREAMRQGKSLIDAATAIGATADALDRSLWLHIGSAHK